MLALRLDCSSALRTTLHKNCAAEEQSRRKNNIVPCMQKGKNSLLLKYLKIWKPPKPARQGYEAALLKVLFASLLVRLYYFLHYIRCKKRMQSKKWPLNGCLF